MDYRSKNHLKYLMIDILQFMVHPKGCIFSCKCFINEEVVKQWGGWLNDDKENL